jgi:acetolactate synthase-1/2/3 large subunit
MKTYFFITMLTGSQYITQFFKQHGMNTIFGYPGGSNLHLLNQIGMEEKKGNLRLVINRHQQFIGHAAEGYARVSGKPGVAITTSGPGITNMITPLQDAFCDSVSLFCISGQVASNVLGMGAFQEINPTDLTRSCTRFNYQVRDPQDLPWALDHALQEANRDKKGPVHLDICSDVFSAEMGDYISPLQPTDKKKTSPRSTTKTNNIKAIAKLLNKSKKPVMIVGKGAMEACFLIRLIAANYQIPVATTLDGLGIMDETSPESLGMYGSVAANKMIQDADLILGIGNRFDDRTVDNPSTFGCHAKLGICHIDIDTHNLEIAAQTIPIRYSVCQDSNAFLTKLAPLLHFHERKEWLEMAKKLKKVAQKNTPSSRLHSKDVIRRLSRKINHMNFIITTGVGNQQMTTAQHMIWKTPGRLLSSRTMGVGLPFAIGAQIANPDAMVFCIDGDGSFQMSFQELATIIQYQLPIKILLMNDQILQAHHVGTNLQNPDFVALANSFGIPSFRCSSKRDLSKSIQKIIETPGPVFCEFKIKGEI